MKMTTQGSIFATTSRSDSKYIGRNWAQKFQNPKFQSLIREVWFVFIVIHHNGEVPGIERNRTHIFSGHGVAGIEKSSRVFFATDRVDFWPLTAHVVAQIEPQDHHRELGEVEGSRTAVVLPPEVAGGRK